MALTEEQYQEQLESQRALDQAESDRKEEEKSNQPQKPEKMGVMFFSIFLLLCIIGDLIDIFTVGTIGWLVGLFIDGIVLLATGMSKAGRKQFKVIAVGLIGDSVPILAVLPFRSIFLTWGFIKSRSSIASAIDSKATSVYNKQVKARNEAQVGAMTRLNPDQSQTGTSQEPQTNQNRMQQGPVTPDPLESERRKREEEYRKGMGTDEASQKNIKATTDWAFQGQQGQQSIRQGDKIDQVEMDQKRKREIEYKKGMGTYEPDQKNIKEASDWAFPKEEQS